MNLPDCWKKAFGFVALVALVSGIVFFDTWSGMIKTWIRSETFAHGFIILPISIWLVWDRWDSYRKLTPNFDWLPLVFVALAGIVWLAGSLANVLVVQEYAVVLMLIAGIWSVLGHNVARRMMFPLGFLLFMVPAGKALVPPLMEFTATFTVDMLRWTGIPVYREGMYFFLPTGSWSVVEACSGLRYVIASVTLGFLYAYLSYTKLWKRALFVVISFLVPIIANGIRAYLIVLLGHLSGMTIAVGVDHLIYGWIFFGFVMAILFYIGSLWRDPRPKRPLEDKGSPVSAQAAGSCYRDRLFAFVVALLLVYAVWPAMASWIRSHAMDEVPTMVQLSGRIGSHWREAEDPKWGWVPRMNGAVSEAVHYFTDGKGGVVGLYLASFGNETQGVELVNSEHPLVHKSERDRWRRIAHQKKTISLEGSSPVDADEYVLRSYARDLLVYKWYQVGDENTANPYLTKILQVKKRFLGDHSPELQVILFTSADPERYRQARERIRRFIGDWLRLRGQ